MQNNSSIANNRWIRVLEFLLYVVLAVAVTWPLSRQLDSAIPQGRESTATVPLFNVWTIWWNADRAQNWYRGYWDAPIFAPTEKTFALSETQPLTVVVAPIQWITESHVAGYNIYLLLMLALNGWATFRLLRRIRQTWFAALMGGVLVQVLPFVHWQSGVLQLVPLCGIIWAIHAWYNFCEKPHWLRGVVVGLAFAATYHLCNYYGLFFSVLFVIAAGWLLGRRLIEWRTWLKLVPGVALAVLLVLPIALVQREVASQHNWSRNEATIAILSAHIGDYSVAANSRIDWPNFAEPDRQNHWLLGPSYVYFAFATVGAVWGLAVSKQRRWTLFCLTLFASSVALSLGPTFAIFGWSPYRSLMHWYPGFAYVRSPFRFAVFAQLSVALLAAAALQNAAAQIARWRSPRWLPIAAVCLLAIAAAASIWPRAPRLYVLPDLGENQEWITWLRDETPEDSTVVCVPFAQGNSAADFKDTVVWMYWSTFHKRTLAEGYTGYFPAHFFELKSAMASFPDPDSIQLLRDRGVDYCIVRAHPMDGPPIAWPDSLQHVFSDETSGVDVYRLE